MQGLNKDDFEQIPLVFLSSLNDNLFWKFEPSPSRSISVRESVFRALRKVLKYRGRKLKHNKTEDFEQLEGRVKLCGLLSLRKNQAPR